MIAFLGAVWAAIGEALASILFVERLGSVAATVFLTLRALRRKSPMTDLPEAAAPHPVADAPIATAAPEAPAPVATTPAVDGHTVVSSVVDTVTNHPDVPADKAAGVAVDILAALAQASPAIFAVTRANPRQQAGVGLGLGLAELILEVFLRHRA